ncbi:hypothetical protein [Metapseudomonas furukawaii]
MPKEYRPYTINTETGRDQYIDRLQREFDERWIDAGCAFSGNFSALERALVDQQTVLSINQNLAAETNHAFPGSMTQDIGV